MEVDSTAPGLTWARYLEGLVAAHGTLAAVALKLAHAEGVHADAATIERALRRLRSKDHRDGGQYGRWLLRTFGLPLEIEQRAQWMGVYHSRFTDLPVSLCLDQLRLWDRPPVAESRARVWLQLGFATCCLRLGDVARAEAHLRRGRAAGRPSTAARVELALVEAYVASRRRDADAVTRALAEVEPLLDAPDLAREERACLAARWLDQRAYQLLHPPDTREADVAGAQALYARIDGTPDAPLFAACKRASGLAYVHHRLGDPVSAAAYARAAIEHAGDGGFVRLRIAALGLLAHVTGGADGGDDPRGRALRAARALEDEDLLGRVERAPHAPER